MESGGIVPAVGLLPSLVRAKLRRLLCAFFPLQLFADELPHPLSLVRVILHLLVAIDVAIDVLA